MSESLKYRIYGDDLQMVEIDLFPGGTVRAEVGAMMYMADGIVMQTGTGGGLLKGFKRMLTGESFCITTFSNTSGKNSQVAFAAAYPGKIIPIDLDLYGGSFLCQKDSFLCASDNIDINIAFTKRLGAGFFGGEGFILQKLTGSGLSFIHAGGTVVRKDLSSGERLRIDTGCIVGFEPSVHYDIQFVGGFKNVLFGGEGLFLATLDGPGTVYLQTLPLSRLAQRIVSATGLGSDRNRGESGMGGPLLRGFLGGD
jgi:uncharacterized protein (TIGR00266 family)